MAKRSGSFNDIPAFKKRFKKKSHENLEAAAQEWHGGIMEVWSGSRSSGRIYKVPGTARTYRASAPGEAPANPTGTTRAGYRWKPEGDNAMVVGSPNLVALWLEKGTEHMKPRPVIEAGYKKAQGAIQRALRRKY